MTKAQATTGDWSLGFASLRHSSFRPLSLLVSWVIFPAIVGGAIAVATVCEPRVGPPLAFLIAKLKSTVCSNIDARALAVHTCTLLDAVDPTKGTPPAWGTIKAAFEARRVFQTICATCHGPEGKGDGAASSALKVKPRNYTDKAWQAEVKDEDIKKIILLGGQAVGKDAAMPAQPQLQGQPEVVDELVKIIRAFGA